MKAMRRVLAAILACGMLCASLSVCAAGVPKGIVAAPVHDDMAAGFYYDMHSNMTMEISMYTDPESDTAGVVRVMDGDTPLLEGQLVPAGTNIYKVKTETGSKDVYISIAMIYLKENGGDSRVASVYIDGKLAKICPQAYAFES